MAERVTHTANTHRVDSKSHPGRKAGDGTARWSFGPQVHAPHYCKADSDGAAPIRILPLISWVENPLDAAISGKIRSMA